MYSNRFKSYLPVSNEKKGKTAKKGFRTDTGN